MKTSYFGKKCKKCGFFVCDCDEITVKRKKELEKLKKLAETIRRG